MELLLLGTAAAEAWPAPYCGCDACNLARKYGGPNVRTRSGALIDDELKIDFGPDTVMQLQRTGRNLMKLKTILFTHQHSDHFVPSELEWACTPFTLTPHAAGTIELWGNSQVIEAIHKTFNAAQLARLPYVYREFKSGDHFTTAAGDEVWAMPADHVAGASTLRIRRGGASGGGKTIFYGHDSGAYPAATFDRLGDGIPLDIALFDCTYGSDDKTFGHMGAAGVVRMAKELRKRNAITGNTRLIATHFSHGGKWMYEELVRFFNPHGIEVSYDGMGVNV